jgi:proteasome lid subunit RPN8/RPN11
MAIRLLIPQKIYEEMIVQARTELPNECCGLLAGIPQGEVAQVTKGYPLVNALASPVEYESESRSLFRAYRDLSERGLEVLAVYHSHPTSPPIPSKKDLARSYSEQVVHLIISLTSDPPSVRGWWLTESDYREADWAIVAEA